MPTASNNVRVRGQSGKHMLGLSSSQFDPHGTFWGAEQPAVILSRFKPAVAGNVIFQAAFGVASGAGSELLRRETYHVSRWRGGCMAACDALAAASYAGRLGFHLPPYDARLRKIGS